MTTLPLRSAAPPARILSAAALAIAAPLLLPMAWDLSGLDLPLAWQMGGVDGFPWREHWLLTSVFHEAGRVLCWGAAMWLCVGVEWPSGPLRRIPRARRWQLAVGVLSSAAVVSVLKSASGASCPWDLQAFGGLTPYLSHWRIGTGSDGGPGHCFPAGHAASGFAFLAGFPAFRHDAPRVAAAWGAGAASAGLLMGLAQQLRGAHFMSHTLWTGWVCWAVAVAVDTLWTLRASR